MSDGRGAAPLPAAGGPGDPADRALAALDAVAFTLERAAAESVKVQAFRTAAQTLRTLPPADLARRLEQGRLTDLAGIGPSTAAVALAAAGGDTAPPYLQAARARPTPLDDALGDAAAVELLQQLRGDLHTHSDWSDGGSPPALMARAARQLGRDYIALTDHSPRLTVARGLSADRLRAQLAVVAELNAALAPFRLLTGIEVDILDDGSLDQDPDLLAELDVVVASVHSKLRMDGAAMTARMVAAVANPHVDVLGHCTGRLLTGRGRPQSTFDAELVFAACARFGVAVEINARPERRDPPAELLALAGDLGCLVSIDTDAHAPGQLDWLLLGAQAAAAQAVPAQRIVGTWPVDEVLSWTARHA